MKEGSRGKQEVVGILIMNTLEWLNGPVPHWHKSWRLPFSLSKVA